MDKLAGRVLFAVGHKQYVVEDAVLCARAWGDWAKLEQDVREGLACLQRAAETCEDPAEGVLDAAAKEFRYARDLITGQEAEAWLAQWALTLDDWTEYLRRGLLRQRWAAESTAMVRRYPSPQPEIDRRVLIEGICSGTLRRVAEKLAGHAAGYERAREEAWIVDNEDDEGSCPQRLEPGFRRFCERVLTPKGMSDQLASRQLDWIRMDCRYVTFATLEQAREAALCIRDDGMKLDELALTAKASVRSGRWYLEELPVDVRRHFWGAHAGELLGPLAWGEGFAVVLVRDTVFPSLADSEIRRRAEEQLLEAAIVHESKSRVQWRCHW